MLLDWDYFTSQKLKIIIFCECCSGAGCTCFLISIRGICSWRRMLVVCSIAALRRCNRIQDIKSIHLTVKLLDKFECFSYAPYTRLSFNIYWLFKCTDYHYSKAREGERVWVWFCRSERENQTQYIWTLKKVSYLWSEFSLSIAFYMYGVSL